MSYGLSVTTGPAVEPIDLATARQHLNLASRDDDVYINSVLIPAVRQRAEAATDRRIISTGLQLTLPRFPRGVLLLPGGRVTEVESVKYVDTAGDEQTLVVDDDYRAYLDREPAEIDAVVSWPAVQSGRRDAVRVRYTAGYGPTAASVPADLIGGMLLALGHLYANREEVVTGVTTSELPQATARVFERYAAGDEFLNYEAGL